MKLFSKIVCLCVWKYIHFKFIQLKSCGNLTRTAFCINSFLKYYLISCLNCTHPESWLALCRYPKMGLLWSGGKQHSWSIQQLHWVSQACPTRLCRNYHSQQWQPADRMACQRWGALTWLLKPGNHRLDQPYSLATISLKNSMAATVSGVFNNMTEKDSSTCLNRFRSYLSVSLGAMHLRKITKHPNGLIHPLTTSPKVRCTLWWGVKNRCIALLVLC